MISLAYLWSLGIGCIGVTILHMNFLPRSDFGRLNTATLLMVAATFLVVTGSIWKAASDHQSIIQVCNGFFNLFTEIRKGIYIKHIK